MNKNLKYTLIVLVIVGGSIIGWMVLKTLIGVVIFLIILFIAWAGFKIGQRFPRKKNAE